MKKLRYWLAERLMRLSWFISPNRTLQQRMNDYALIYGVGMSVINPKDIYLDPSEHQGLLSTKEEVK